LTGSAPAAVFYLPMVPEGEGWLKRCPNIVRWQDGMAKHQRLTKTKPVFPTAQAVQ